jgi:hypothetical protein
VKLLNSQAVLIFYLKFLCFGRIYDYSGVQDCVLYAAIINF